MCGMVEKGNSKLSKHREVAHRARVAMPLHVS